MSNRIFKIKEEYKNFAKYVKAIGLPELAYYGPQAIDNVTSEHDPRNNPYAVFQDNPDKKFLIEYNIVPYGAASSYLGAIQDFARGKVPANAIDPKTKTANIWDDEWGVNFVDVEHGSWPVPSTFKIEALLLDLHHRRNSITWTQLWRMYVDYCSRHFKTQIDEGYMNSQGLPLDTTVVNQMTFHIDPIGIQWFAGAYNKFFLDLDHERFVWCHLLSYVKHAATGNKGALNIAKIVTDGRFTLERGRPFVDRCNTEWINYSRCKKYGPKPIIVLSYEDLIVKQDVGSIKVFLEATTDADASDETVSTVQRLFKSYHEENEKLMSTWDTLKPQFDSKIDWDRTYG